MKTIRLINGILLAIISLNAFGGGYYAISGAPGVPLEWLKGSPFNSYLVPGLFLFIVIGGGCALAAVLNFRNSKNASGLSMACGVLLLVWIGVQVGIIGYVSWLQPAIFISGAFITFTSWLRPKSKA